MRGHHNGVLGRWFFSTPLWTVYRPEGGTKFAHELTQLALDGFTECDGAEGVALALVSDETGVAGGRKRSVAGGGGGGGTCP